MSKSSVVKTVGGVTTKITTMSRVHTSLSQQQILQQQYQQQQQQKMQENVNTVQPQYMMDTRKEQYISTSSFQNNRQNQYYDNPAPRMEIQQPPTENTCSRCKRSVYKMVEVIAENQVWHRHCFRCNECDKQLNRHSKVDGFQIHNGVAYCKHHFMQLFGKRDAEPQSYGSSRPSDQYHAGRENIQKTAVKTTFQLPGKTSPPEKEATGEQQNIGIIRGSTVLSKMQKFHAKGMDVGDVGLNNIKPNEKERKDETYDDESIYSEDYDDDTDVDLLRAKRLLRDRPLRIDDMDEIKNKFVGGIEQDREVRFLERKQEVQDSRSRIYMGKQARTRELYENALDRLKNSNKLRNRGLLLDYELDNVKAAAEKTQNVKQRFESGDVYRRAKSAGREFHDSVARQCSQQFQISNNVTERMQKLAKQQAQDEFIKSRTQVPIMDTAKILNQFEFFENNNHDKQKCSSIKIDGVNITGVRTNGVVEKAKNAYIGRINKNKAKGRRSF